MVVFRAGLKGYRKMAREKREGEMILYIHLITHARARNTHLLFQHESLPTLLAAVRIKKK